MKYLKTAIFILILIIVIILFVCFIFLEQNKIDSENNLKIDENPEGISDNGQTNLDGIKGHESDTNLGYIDYYTICNCINDTLLESEIQFIPISIKKLETSKTEKFLAYGVTYNMDMNYVGDVYYGVYFDLNNFTYLVEKINTNNGDISEIYVRDLESIEFDEKNRLVYKELTNEYKYIQIFNNMKYLMILKPEIAYEYLDNDYKTQRFGNVENFKQYVENNKDHLINIEPKSYKANEDDKIITIQDQYSNWYEFSIKDTMEYTAKIDNIIIMDDEDIKEYIKLDENQKIKFNLRRWLKLINYKEYELAYNYLDEQFKLDNYSTLKEFANTMFKNYSKFYDDISIKKLTNEGNIYTAEIELNISSEEFETKYLTIIIKLKGNQDFVMSFNVDD